jgi:hypothetical protein
MKRRYFLSAVGALLLRPVDTIASESSLVLVSGARSSLPAISPKDVRKIFLGVPLLLGDKEVVPLLNGSVEETKELFLQKVLFMSGPVYERHIVGRVFRNGGARIAEYQDAQILATALSNNLQSISFMAGQDARKLASIKILGDL